jgi:hypothetical protein
MPRWSLEGALKSRDFRFESGYAVLCGGMLGLRLTSTADSSCFESTVWRSNNWSKAEWCRRPERRSSVSGSFADPPSQTSTIFQAPPFPAVSPTGASRSDPHPSHRPSPVQVAIVLILIPPLRNTSVPAILQLSLVFGISCIMTSDLLNELPRQSYLMLDSVVLCKDTPKCMQPADATGERGMSCS